jgi:Spermidine synthase
MLHFFEENNISLHLSDIDLIQKSSSAKQKLIELFNHKILGKILVIDNEVQHVEAWTPFYHESVVHIPAFFIPEIKNVLILGGGSFFAAKEVLRYSSVKKVIMVDHDDVVIRLMKDNYSHVQEITENKKYTLVTQDAITFLKTTRIKFDLIINDALDLLRGDHLVFDHLTSCLSHNGICSDIIYRHIFEAEKTIITIKELRKKYNAIFSLVIIPEYPGVLHLLSIWSNTKHLKQDSNKIENVVQKEWIKNKSNPCLIYDPRFINYYLHLPPYLKKWISII